MSKTSEFCCYDCGSTIPKHHTPRCDMSDPGDILDLPQVPGTQWWTGSLPPDGGGQKDGAK